MSETRLIDVEELPFYCKYEGYCTRNISYCQECDDYVLEYRDIKDQSTAYDIDKVVEQLKKEFKKYYGDNWDKAPYLVKAIDIVKTGGISKEEKNNIPTTFSVTTEAFDTYYI